MTAKQNELDGLWPKVSPPTLIEKMGAYFLIPNRRPGPFEPIIREAAVADIMPALLRWLGEPADCPEQTAIEHELRRICDAGDASSMLCRLHDKSWSVDDELHQILSNLEDHLSQHHRDLTRQWAQAYGPEPNFDIGDEVSATVWAKNERREEIGIVASIDRSMAKCVIRFPSLGHIATGPGTHGYVLDIEDIKTKPS